MDLLLSNYLWLKAAHVVFVIFWMAGLFQLPRYLVYHQEALTAGDTAEAASWIDREAKLRRIILTPSMIAVWLLGLTLVLTPGVIDWRAGWWHTKLLSVLLMSGFHGHLSAARRRFAADERPKSERYWRMVNEVPAVLMAIIVIMVIVKPF